MSAELELEQAHLVKAEQHITDGEVRVSEQLARIRKLRSDGHDTREAEHLLNLLQTTLDEWGAHRDEILKRIAHLEAK